MIFNILNSIDLLMIRTLLVFLGIVILCRFAIALSIRNQNYISYPRDCRIKYRRKENVHDKYLFEMDNPWLKHIEMNEDSGPIDLNREYEEIIKLSYDHNHIIK